MIRIAITRGDLYGDPADRLLALGQVAQRGLPDPPGAAELVELATGAQAVLGVSGDPFTEETFTALPGLQVLSLASVGYDSIDLAAAARHAVTVTNAPGVLSEAVADTTFGLMLGARRRYVEADRLVRRGAWTASELTLMVGPDVHGSRLGLVGYGSIAKAVARRARGFGMDVVFHDEYAAPDDFAREVSWEELLTTSDVVSLHCPLTPETRGIINEQALRMMKSDATVINTARGGVIDEPALIRALTEGWIGSAGLDVQATEPNPDATSVLHTLENVVVLPHIGSASISARLAMTDIAARNIEAVLAGEPALTPVTAAS
ncbi:MAG: 2-hydroxyacid dehydrogenase [Arachnia sp.]